MTELRKRAMTWLQSCQTQTPTIEEVERLIIETAVEFGDLYYVTETLNRPQ